MTEEFLTAEDIRRCVRELKALEVLPAEFSEWMREQLYENTESALKSMGYEGPKMFVSNYNECLMECIRYNALYQILRGC